MRPRPDTMPIVYNRMAMKRTSIGLLAVLIVALAWPPTFFLFFSDHFRPNSLGRGQMRDFELQKLLNANRWVIDIPPEKDGWFLELTIKSGDDITASGGASMRGGTRIVLLARRNTHDRRIEYVWYQTTNDREIIDEDGPFTMTLNISSSGNGSIDDPLASARVTSVRPDGQIAVGDAIYRGG